MSNILMREKGVADLIAQLQAAEPEDVATADPFDCDYLDGDADHTLGMYRITNPPTLYRITNPPTRPR